MPEAEARKLLGTELKREYKVTQALVYVWRNHSDCTLQCGDETPDPKEATILSRILPHEKNTQTP